ncbi:MAG: Unknown protein [uncultured Thiotrichaceae bacterium]|uniref:Uncharacterized protein n=1 Tax=uncultured Thiotrichaceae bacterium TaxID=298394 RepID=A0A6S6UEW3_9GAMM|nr:MAG: Unknown protein [uncultured Thiotrichaceae bacterium]
MFVCIDSQFIKKHKKKKLLTAEEVREKPPFLLTFCSLFIHVAILGNLSIIFVSAYFINRKASRKSVRLCEKIRVSIHPYPSEGEEMESKDYCPDCKTFNIKRVHRGFIKKKILMMDPTYLCNKCGSKFTIEKMDKNPTRIMPELLQ